MGEGRISPINLVTLFILLDEVCDFLTSHIGLVKVLLEVSQRVLKIVNLLVVGQVFVVHEPVNHVIMCLLKYAVIIDELDHLFRLYVLRDAFLRLDELVKSLQLPSHMVNRIVYSLFDLHKLVIITHIS